MNLDLGRPMSPSALYDAMEATATAIRESADTAWAPMLFANESNAVGFDSGDRLALGLDSCQQGGSLRIGPLGSSMVFNTRTTYGHVRVFNVQGLPGTCPCHRPASLDPAEVTETFVRFFRQALSQH